MSDVQDYMAKYQHYSHRDLYSMVTRADAGSVTLASSLWRRVHSDLVNLTRDLNTDVQTVMPTWHGSASIEFQNRMSSVAGFSSSLTDDAWAIADGLDQMAVPMVNAINDAAADNPANTDNHDNALKFAAIGAVTLNPVAIVGGGLLGMKMDNDEAERAHQRMIQVVSKLAAAYDVTTHSTWPTSISAEPANLPGGTSGATGGGHTSGAGVQVRSAPRLAGSGAVVQQATDTTGTSVASAPTFDEAPPLTATSAGPSGPLIAGTAPLIGIGVTGAIASGVGDARRGPAAAPGKSLGSTLDRQSGVRGVLGRDEPGTSQVRSAARPGGATDEGPTVRRGSTGTFAGDEEHANRSAYAGRGANPTDEDEDERTTWLTEDEIVWGQTRDTPPPILG